MTNHKEQILAAQWTLERNLSWIAAAEVKIGVIVAINTAMLGGLGASFSTTSRELRTEWAWLFTIAAVILLGIGLFCAAMAALPRVKGPKKSLLFFGCIGPLNEVDYTERFKRATEAEILEDWTVQIHRNAQIACKKFQWVRNGMLWSFLALPPWFAAIILLLK